MCNEKVELIDKIYGKCKQLCDSNFMSKHCLYRLWRYLDDLRLDYENEDNEVEAFKYDKS